MALRGPCTNKCMTQELNGGNLMNKNERATTSRPVKVVYSEDGREVKTVDRYWIDNVGDASYWDDYYYPFDNYDCGLVDHSINQHRESIRDYGALTDLMN